MMKEWLCFVALTIMFYVIIGGSAPTWIVAVYWGLVSVYWALNSKGGDKHD